MSTEIYSLSVLRRLEAESVHILREAAAEFERPVLMFSAGKDSSVLLHLARKAFHPGRVPFPLLHIDTGYEFPELRDFRDRTCAQAGVDLRVLRNEAGLVAEASPADPVTDSPCDPLEAQVLLDALRAGGYDAAIGGARRDEERSRAKERIFSLRDAQGRWDPKNQRPELWSLYNGRIGPGQSIRVFPLSNWAELDVWRYIGQEGIEVAALYFAAERDVVRRAGQLIPVGDKTKLLPGERVERMVVRFRSLGCHACTGAIASTARTVPEIIDELARTRYSERSTRVVDNDGDGSRERRKREGFF